MTKKECLDTSEAFPDPFFAKPPYKAALFNEKSGWSGVMNANGVNCLRFRSKPGAVVTDFATAQKIATKFNDDTSRSTSQT